MRNLTLIRIVCAIWGCMLGESAAYAQLEEQDVELCFTSVEKNCPATPDICGDTECNQTLQSWQDDPLDSRKEQPVYVKQCPANTLGAFNINTIQTVDNFDNQVETDGFKREESSTLHICYKLRPCALSCTETSEVHSTPAKRWKPGQGSGTAGTITLFKAYCNEGVQSGDEESFYYFESVGALIPVCNPAPMP